MAIRIPVDTKELDELIAKLEKVEAALVKANTTQIAEAKKLEPAKATQE